MPVIRALFSPRQMETQVQGITQSDSMSEAAKIFTRYLMCLILAQLLIANAPMGPP